MESARAAGVRRGYEGWNRGDFTPPFELTEDFEFHPPTDLPGKDVYRGREGMDGFARGLGDAFESLQIEPVEIDERGDNVLAHVRLVALGRHSGLTVEREEFHVSTFRGAELCRVRCFPERAEAMAAMDER